MEDSIYSTERGKFTAIVNEIERCHKMGSLFWWAPFP